MAPIRTFLIRFLRQLPALVVAALVAMILIYEAPDGAADFEPLSLRPYVHPTAKVDWGVATLSPASRASSATLPPVPAVRHLNRV
jgi:hypothetical protein